MPPLEIQLRDVQDADLEILFEHQLDPEATTMAAFPARDHDSHLAHWRKIMADDMCITKAIVVDGVVAGHIGSWIQDGHREIGYWIGKEHWGKGIATAAVIRLVGVVEERPIVAWVAKGNAGSVRVLEKAGFTFDHPEETHLVYTLASELDLAIERVLPAPLSAVFAAFSANGGLARWWGPEGFTIPSLEFTPEVGHRYRIEMQPPGGEPFYLSGEFLEVDPPVRLVYTFSWEDPDPDDVETVVNLSFRDLGERTEVSFTQGHFKTEARRELHKDGWTDTFNKLEKFLLGRT